MGVYKRGNIWWISFQYWGRCYQRAVREARTETEARRALAERRK